MRKFLLILEFGILTFTGMAMAGGLEDSNDLRLKTGDLLFRGDTTASGVSMAISDVTQTGNDDQFTHVGMVEMIDDEVNVIHADPVNGVCLEPLDSFLYDENGKKLLVEAYRLKPEYQESIDEAIERARSVIGQPYNFSYIIEDDGYYCSELIWWAFKEESVFSLQPMNFRDPQTGEFHHGWVEYYDELGIDIPQGDPGCNPNGMAASDNLYHLGAVE
ncbi:MAG: YiiX/YebB-like N1pC/P60 family cysteine hydrolase [Marinilabilia sp.]